jgi:phosphoribosylamine--glycine ligase
VVIKADGLAAGKGVTVCASRDAALAAVAEAMEQKKFGDAGARGRRGVPPRRGGLGPRDHGRDDAAGAPERPDHKRVRDGDQGPNTGGMGAYSPAPVLTDKLLDVVVRTILVPTLHGLKIEGIEFRGVLYAG